MNGKQLKNSILQWAIQGKLVPQDPNDEPASVLLERIRAEKARLVKEKNGAEWEVLGIGAQEQPQQREIQVIMVVIFYGLELVNSIIAL